jgi:hypothetical protein
MRSLPTNYSFAVHAVFPIKSADVTVRIAHSEILMRSEVIFRASEAIENKYALCQTVSKAARSLHIGTRSMTETINNAFLRIASDVHAPPIGVAD